jgi:pectinesterase
VFIKDSKFYEHKNTAAIWHAGGYDINQKFVIKNSSFDGVPGFELGRHHYEAQFYLLNALSQKIGDQEIYRVHILTNPNETDYNWGKRNYFYNCIKDGGNPEWLANNLNTSCFRGKWRFTASWTFDGKWDPETKSLPTIIDLKLTAIVCICFFRNT